jgi:hypothetical protein
VSNVRRPRRNACGTQVKREARNDYFHALRVERMATRTPAPNGALEHIPTVDIELQERGKICLGLFLTREGDEKTELDILVVTDIRRRDIQLTSRLTGESEVWARTQVRTQARKLAQCRRLRRGRLSRTAPAAVERESLTKLGSDTSRGARVQRLRALQVIGGGSRALVERVQGESGLRDEAAAIAELFILPGARPWEHSSAVPEMRQAERLVALGTAIST